MTPRESYRLKCVEYMLISLIKGWAGEEAATNIIQKIYTRAAKGTEGEDNLEEELK